MSQRSDTNVSVGFNVKAVWSLATVLSSVLLVVVGLFQMQAMFVAIGAGVLGLPASYAMIRNGRSQ